MKFVPLFLFLFVFFPLCASANPQVKEYTRYYTIEGKDIDTLKRQMHEKGPKDSRTKQRMWAYTKWNVKWSLNFSEQSSSCILKKTNVDVQILYILPKWVDRDDADPELVEKWDAYFEKLMEHERQHAKHGKDAGRHIIKTFKGMPKMKKCSSIKRSARKAAGEIIDFYAKRDIIFDKETKHGITDGVVLK